MTFDLPKGVGVRVRLIDKATGKAVAGHHVYYIKLPSNTNEGQAAVASPWLRSGGGPDDRPSRPGDLLCPGGGQ